MPRAERRVDDRSRLEGTVPAGSMISSSAVCCRMRDRLLRIVDAWQLDDDLIVAARLDQRLADAETIDPPLEGLSRAFQGVAVERLARDRAAPAARPAVLPAGRDLAVPDARRGSRATS